MCQPTSDSSAGLIYGRVCRPQIRHKLPICLGPSVKVSAIDKRGPYKTLIGWPIVGVAQDDKQNGRVRHCRSHQKSSRAKLSELARFVEGSLEPLYTMGETAHHHARSRYALAGRGCVSGSSRLLLVGISPAAVYIGTKRN